ncbi:hypothetical protein CANTEDRAFT_115053 [Yamadazyma tenuis ATCC 10573]|uniref:Mitochondrial peculiar membrane protein 1 n=1 Tax=Candida tenuis (strain ATCC 10573 / BCRC 21748 / CBS 615 / JCM 9827 / NBRC 10315 / NRRL Y-1498 / VKM Y-70) TaxID=590646 RepID=G3B786_CANTC|nr:uncharacterized protein CANTEDRAFT_115053 [Yamadazyma tenuis ATCC 10573]EGV61592.1 hypothetical protein CANTEDRAFT_115053 [Yamadazyma tenuis ATCC 10573]
MSKDSDKEFNQHLNEVKDNFKALTTSLLSLTSESFNGFNDIAKQVMDDPTAWKNFEEWALRKDTWEFPSIYEKRSGEPSPDRESLSGCEGGRRRGFGFGNFSGLGLFSFGTPSIRKYNECIDKKGQQLYDTHGHWRCLFPNAEIPNKVLALRDSRFPGYLLTKEEFQKEVVTRGINPDAGQYDLGDQGMFFSQFEDYMNWKAIMHRNIKEQRRQWRNQLREEKKQLRKEREKSRELQPVGKDSDSSRRVVSSSTETNYETNTNNDTVFKETKIQYFDDGTSLTTTITKSKPFGQDWQTQSVDEVKGDEKPQGWFWK